MDICNAISGFLISMSKLLATSMYCTVIIVISLHLCLIYVSILVINAHPYETKQYRIPRRTIAEIGIDRAFCRFSRHLFDMLRNVTTISIL